MNQEELEKTYSRKNLINLLSEEIQINWLSELVYSIEKYMSIHYSYESKNIRVAKLNDSLEIATSILINILKLRGEIGTVQQVSCGIAKDIGDDTLSGITTAAELLAVCDNGSLYELMAHNYSGNPTGTLAIEPKIKPSEYALTVIAQYMYVPPNVEVSKWVKNDKGGLKTVSDNCILGKNNSHHEYQALDVLNTLQKIAWEIDPRIEKLRERPNKPLNTAEKAKQFSVLRTASKNIYQAYLNKKFYFIWKFDKRGRMYSNGYHINLQSTDYKKALLNFSKKEVITL